MAAMLAGAAASSAARSPALRWLVGAVVTLPTLLTVLLMMLLGGGAAADAASALATPDTLRPGVVPAGYEPLVLRAAQTCPGITAPLLAAQLELEAPCRQPGRRAPGFRSWWARDHAEQGG